MWLMIHLLCWFIFFFFFFVSFRSVDGGRSWWQVTTAHVFSARSYAAGVVVDGQMLLCGGEAPVVGSLSDCYLSSAANTVAPIGLSINFVGLPIVGLGLSVIPPFRSW
jgi:hypothetical protein